MALATVTRQRQFDVEKTTVYRCVNVVFLGFLWPVTSNQIASLTLGNYIEIYTRMQMRSSEK